MDVLPTPESPMKMTFAISYAMQGFDCCMYYILYFKNMAEDDYKNRQNQFRQQLQQLLQQDQVNLVLDSINIFFSTVLMSQYIHSTYDMNFWNGRVWGVFNTLIHLYMLTEWGFRLLLLPGMPTRSILAAALLPASAHRTQLHRRELGPNNAILQPALTSSNDGTQPHPQVPRL
jgi:hypothetical protein